MLKSSVLVLSLLVAGQALAQTPSADPAKAPSAAQAAQRERMTSCNRDAGDRKLAGDARKGYMKDCLAGNATAPEKTLTPQQAKMKTCNADASAKSLKGKERTTFMSTCLKG